MKPRDTIDVRPFRRAFPILYRDRNLIGLLVEPGWREILWDLSASLEALAEAQIAAGLVPIAVAHVKEKFGGLRFHLHHGTDVARDLIRAAQARAWCTCEVCGSPGRLWKKGGWFSTRCNLHAPAEGVAVTVVADE